MRLLSGKEDVYKDYFLWSVRAGGIVESLDEFSLCKMRFMLSRSSSQRKYDWV